MTIHGQHMILMLSVTFQWKIMVLEVGNGNAVVKWLSGNQLHQLTVLETKLFLYHTLKTFVNKLSTILLQRLLLIDTMNSLVALTLMVNTQSLLISGWIFGI